VNSTFAFCLICLTLSLKVEVTNQNRLSKYINVTGLTLGRISSMVANATN